MLALAIMSISALIGLGITQMFRNPTRSAKKYKHARQGAWAATALTLIFAPAAGIAVGMWIYADRVNPLKRTK